MSRPTFKQWRRAIESEKAKLHSKCENPPEGGFPRRFFACLKRFQSRLAADHPPKGKVKGKCATSEGSTTDKLIKVYKLNK